MATVGQVYYNVIDNNSGGYISSSNIKIFEDIVSQYPGAKVFNKLGVQAPPGTRMVVNGTKSIMVGRTGIYELDKDIQISNLYFVRPRKYIKDEEASAEAKEKGTKGMLAAAADRKAALEELQTRYGNVPEQDSDPNYDAYWKEYREISNNYIIAYEKAVGQFSDGVNGIYILPNPSNIDADENYDDLYNVIVDFIYE